MSTEPQLRIMLSDAPAVEMFAKLFHGNNSERHYEFGDAGYRVVDGGLTRLDFTGHLAGSKSVLSIPILPSGLCHFGAIDIDRHNPEDEAIDHAALAKKVTSLDLPLVLDISKNRKGGHLWIFFKEAEGFSAAAAQRLLNHYKAVLGLPSDTEVFPKQTHLKSTEMGNGINLPHFGKQRFTFGENGETLDFKGFVALATKRQSYGSILERDLRREPRDSAPRASAPPDTRQDHPMSALTARKIHQDNLASLRAARQGEGNALLNSTSFFAGRAFAAGLLEGTEAEIKATLLDIVTKEWKKPHPEHSAKDTIISGWDSGFANPLQIAEDEWPEVTAAMEELNKRFFLVGSIGGKCRIGELIEETDDSGKSYTLETRTTEDFLKFYQDEFITIGEDEDGNPKRDSKGRVWLYHPRKVKYERVVFKPQGNVPANVKNLWTGFTVEAKKGDCSRYLSHIRENICQNDAVKYRYLFQWLSYLVKHPGDPGRIVIGLFGAAGTGKNCFTRWIAALFGAHSVQVGTPDAVTKNFNAHLQDKCVLICNEVSFREKKHEGIIKNYATEKKIRIEPKGVNSYDVDNCLHIIIVSNDEVIVNAAADDRRFFVLQCGDAKKQNASYFAAITKEMENGGTSALLHHLLHEVDTRDFSPYKAPPRTEELKHQITMTPARDFVREILSSRQVPGEPGKDHTIHVNLNELVQYAIQQRSKQWGDVSIKHLQDVVGKRGLNLKSQLLYDQDGNTRRTRLRYFTFLPLKECRITWDKVFGATDWPEDDSMWIPFNPDEQRGKR